METKIITGFETIQDVEDTLEWIEENTDHYPSLELCKKLKEIGFPHTEFSYYPEIWKVMMFSKNSVTWPCPSVMEMLDVIPDDIRVEILPNNKYYTVWCYFTNIDIDSKRFGSSDWSCSVPNALAEMIIWLHENKHISFTK